MTTFALPARGSAALFLLVLAASAAAQSPAKLKLACVGDSITEGAGLSDPASQSYPAKLGRLLAPTHTVRNFGRSGATLLAKGDLPYIKQSQYTSSRNWNPDVVIIMLGSNDAKPYNWRYGTNFITDYLALIESYTSLTSKPSICLCTPCPAYGAGAFDIKPGTVATNVVPDVREVGRLTGWPIIEVNTVMGGHREWFPDLIHPNSFGMTAMATAVHGFLSGTAEDDTIQPSLTPVLGDLARLHLFWPSRGSGLMLEENKGLRETNTWTVVDRPAFNDGTWVSVSNLAPGALRFYRLRRPWL